MTFKNLNLSSLRGLGCGAGLFLFTSAGACSAEGTPEPEVDLSASPAADLSTMSGGEMGQGGPDMAMFSCCGHPGDPGNALGVGKFCTVQDDCKTGTLCAYALQPAKQSYFCTKICTSATDTSCGEGATCTKDSGTGIFGCVPNVCLATVPVGCSN